MTPDKLGPYLEYLKCTFLRSSLKYRLCLTDFFQIPLTFPTFPTPVGPTLQVTPIPLAMSWQGAPEECPSGLLKLLDLSQKLFTA